MSSRTKSCLMACPECKPVIQDGYASLSEMAMHRSLAKFVRDGSKNPSFIKMAMQEDKLNT